MKTKNEIFTKLTSAMIYELQEINPLLHFMISVSEETDSVNSCSCTGESLYLQCLGDIIKLLTYKNYTTTIK